VLVLACALITSCSTPRTDQELIEQTIDPAIVGEERRKMAEIMRLLPPAHRDNVIYLSENGQIYANKPSLRGEFRLSRQISDRVYETAWGEKFVLPSSGSPDDVSKLEYTCIPVSTGPFRRIATQRGVNVSGGRFSYAYAQVSLPGEGSVYGLQNSSGDQIETPFVYLGGHSTTSSGSIMTEVDGGVQWSQAKKDWALYLKSGSNVAVQNNQVRLFSPVTISLEFYVPSDGSVAIRVTGGTVRTGINRTLVTSASGWSKSGVGNVIKRLTTIAQASTNPNSGSFLLNVSWLDTKLGRFTGTGLTPIGQGIPVAELRQWGQYSRDIDPDNVNDGFGIGCSQPANRVTVDAFLSYAEDVNIDLR